MTREPEQRDWFLGAFESTGSVQASLDRVVEEQAERMNFVKALQVSLASTDQGIDRVTALSRMANRLEKTLKYRLAVLRPEHAGPWFRRPPTTSVGPFAETILNQPVFAPWGRRSSGSVRANLLAAWQQSQLELSPFYGQEPCLWHTLLELASNLSSLCELRMQGGSFELDKLPEELPGTLVSRALTAFLNNVRSEITTIRGCLGRCLTLLLTASDKFWKAHHDPTHLSAAVDSAELDPDSFRQKTIFANRKGDPVGPQGISNKANQSSKHPRSPVDRSTVREPGSFTETYRAIREDRAQDMRAEFRRRRTTTSRNTAGRNTAGRNTAKSSVKSIKTTVDIDALSFMGFAEFPAVSDLRSRYRQLAKQYHPDQNPQHEERFKRLTKAYNHLTSRVVSKANAAI